MFWSLPPGLSVLLEQPYRIKENSDKFGKDPSGLVKTGQPHNYDGMNDSDVREFPCPFSAPPELSTFFTARLETTEILILETFGALPDPGSMEECPWRIVYSPHRRFGSGGA